MKKFGLLDVLVNKWSGNRNRDWGIGCIVKWYGIIDKINFLDDKVADFIKTQMLML